MYTTSAITIAGIDPRLCESRKRSMQRVAAARAAARNRQSRARSVASPSAGKMARAKNAALALR